MNTKAFENFNLMISSGSIRAILAGTGSALACKLAHCGDFETIGGVSGGSIPSLLLAGKVPPKTILDNMVELDFAKVLPVKNTVTGFLTSMVKGANKRCHAYEGLRSSGPLGELAQSLVPVWPDNYWTVAAINGNPLLFTAKGIFEYRGDKVVQIFSGRPSVSHAIRASCAIPGIIEAVDYLGMRMFDGGYSVHGGMPCELIANHFSLKLAKVVAVDFTSNQKHTWLTNALMHLSKRISNHIGPEFAHFYEKHAACVIQPEVAWLNGRLPLNLTPDQKKMAIMEGFNEAFSRLKAKGLISQRVEDRLELASLSFSNLYAIVSMSDTHLKTSWFDWFVRQTKSALNNLGLAA